MLPALSTTATGLSAEQVEIDSISNNLANLNTVGFKKSDPVFETLAYQQHIQPGASSSGNTLYPSGYDMGTGVRVAATVPVLTQGNLKQTNEPLDMAIQGAGYFQVLQPNGQIAYTRDGAFQLDQNGHLVTADGYQVLPNITIPPNATSVTIGQDGTISATTPGSSNAAVVGQIQLANFVNPQGLQPIGNNLFLQTNSSGAAITGNPQANGLGSVNQNFLEQSNTSVVDSMVNLIAAERAYQLGTNAASAAGRTLSELSAMAASA
ncbi:flagellar basal body rod protein FlgG [Defluviimonas sp. 20V17]|uniref:Flagellar basal-body rod protein FlgG n=1 Tax=Allgaiera indica TaxID=765699 RepID=A0AAN4UN97_9RHOB|nr:flagellar basal-body rod protein FlgG [Allgaiera indica]KDB03488.1 flagellar basal body rod protein FlgG [Defluviimonas sp. 20V17]GHD98118.1 flagellar basal-body rod protein FlgG [Allgaiera indica]SDW53517.1 flagellar basal-body rod protein FlgG [Allgaiera indica]